MTMTDDQHWEEFSNRLADALIELPGKQEEALRELRAMGAEIERIESHRVRLMQYARQIGVPAQKVADAVGISRQQVYRIAPRD